MEVKDAYGFDPLPNLWMFVRAIVVHNQMQVHPCLHFSSGKCWALVKEIHAVIVGKLGIGDFETQGDTSERCGSCVQ